MTMMYCLSFVNYGINDIFHFLHNYENYMRGSQSKFLFLFKFTIKLNSCYYFYCDLRQKGQKGAEFQYLSPDMTKSVSQDGIKSVSKYLRILE